jgi:hypothetical protein
MAPDDQPRANRESIGLTRCASVHRAFHAADRPPAHELRAGPACANVTRGQVTLMLLPSSKARSAARSLHFVAERGDQWVTG